MSFKNESKSAMVSAEVALSTTLAVSVLFVAIGLFSNNLSGMTNTGLSNAVNNNDVKTSFSSFNRSYSDSQINIQVMGEQGLDVLRKDANNKALELISSDKEAKENANEIGYLALTIEAIVGQPDICVYMKKESDKFCNEDDIGGYSYKVDSDSPSTIILKKVDTTGNDVNKVIKLNTDNTVSNILANEKPKIHKDNQGKSSLTKHEKSVFLDDISENLESHIRSNALLRRPHRHT